jgi:hypothetical protein
MAVLATSHLQLQLEVLLPLAAFLLIVVGAPIFVLRRMRATRAPSQWAGPEGAAGPGVSFTFHTYSGLLVFFTQTTHTPRLPHRIAVEYLRELHRYNLIRCLVPYPGIVFVPILSCIEYRSQLRAIQQASMGLEATRGG